MVWIIIADATSPNSSHLSLLVFVWMMGVSWTIYNILQRKFLEDQKSCGSLTLHIKSNTKQHQAIPNSTINTPCPSFLICIELSPMIQYKEGPTLNRWKEKYLLLLSVVVCVVEPSNIPWAKYITPPAPAPHVEKTKENPTLKKYSALGCITVNL